MCGIRFSVAKSASRLITTHSKYNAARGPDDTHTYAARDEAMGLHINVAFYRLAIVGGVGGTQPFVYGSVVVVCNGEIYNYKKIAEKHGITLDTTSDCEIVAKLYQLAKHTTRLEQCMAELNGEYAYVILDRDARRVFFSRDVYGVKGLYYALDSDSLVVASSLDAFDESSHVARHVPPNMLHSVLLTDFSMISFAMPDLLSEYTPSKLEPRLVENQLMEALYSRTHQSERPLGFFLSGGLDSSVLLSAALYHKMLHGPPSVFTFGFSENAPDVKSARIVVDYLRGIYGPNCIDWHLVLADTAEGIAAIPEVIRALGTCDTTTVRASVPMYLLSRYVAANTPVRVLISGEGSDEVFGGYLYTHYAPDAYALKADCMRLLRDLYMFDCLRADRCTAANGLEVRPPFLDSRFVAAVVSSESYCAAPTEPELARLTKPMLRRIARTYLPDSIVLGRKEAFSDAVGLSWYDEVAAHAASHGCSTADYFKKIFIDIYGQSALSLVPYYWLPQWIDTGGESSARALPIYKQT
jgi:asparagine synthase (glutamine-hydrolysing)